MSKDSLKKLLPFILGGVLLVAIRWGRALWVNFQTAIETAKAVKNTQDSYKKTVNIDGSEITVNLDTLASAIFYSFYNSKGKNRFNEDEQAAIVALSSCPKNLIPNLAAVYSAKYGKVLKDDLIEKLSKGQFESVKSLFE